MALEANLLKSPSSVRKSPCTLAMNDLFFSRLAVVKELSIPKAVTNLLFGIARLFKVESRRTVIARSRCRICCTAVLSVLDRVYLYRIATSSTQIRETVHNNILKVIFECRQILDGRRILDFIVLISRNWTNGLVLPRLRHLVTSLSRKKNLWNLLHVTGRRAIRGSRLKLQIQFQSKVSTLHGGAYPSLLQLTSLFRHAASYPYDMLGYRISKRMSFHGYVHVRYSMLAKENHRLGQCILRVRQIQGVRSQSSGRIFEGSLSIHLLQIADQLSMEQWELQQSRCCNWKTDAGYRWLEDAPFCIQAAVSCNSVKGRGYASFRSRGSSHERVARN